VRRSSPFPVIIVVAASVLGACMNPEIQARQIEEIQIVAQEVAELRGYMSDVDVVLDSLRRVVARQDTAIRLLADFTGVPLPGPPPY